MNTNTKRSLRFLHLKLTLSRRAIASKNPSNLVPVAAIWRKATPPAPQPVYPTQVVIKRVQGLGLTQDPARHPHIIGKLPDGKGATYKCSEHRPQRRLNTLGALISLDRLEVVPRCSGLNSRGCFFESTYKYTHISFHLPALSQVSSALMPTQRRIYSQQTGRNIFNTTHISQQFLPALT